MNKEIKTLETIKTITAITNKPKLKFEDKLQQILLEVVNYMGSKKGSIMLLKGRKNLVVSASTNSDIIGFKQALDKESPSSWVFKNKIPLYFNGSTNGNEFSGKKYDHYKKDAFLLAPIQTKNRVIGVLSITEKIGTDQFSKDEQEMLLNITGYLISSLENQRLNESLRKSKKNLRETNKELKKLEKIRSELFNMLIHDLKGPISEVVANLDILSYTVTSENREYVDAAQTSCDTLYRMILDLLDIGRLEEGSLTLMEEKIEASDFVKECLSRIHGIAKIRNLHLPEDHLKTGQNCFIYGDRAILLRVMQNLLINAVHHSPHGETIIAGFEYSEAQEICFYIQDNGPGILPKYQEAIFNKYVQIGKKDEKRSYSTGLGLTFCKLAVEAHKGNISVESDGKNGSRFLFTMPLGH